MLLKQISIAIDSYIMFIFFYHSIQQSLNIFGFWNYIRILCILENF